MTKINVHQSVYHRNGVSGVGFYAIRFDYTEDGRKRQAIATVSAGDVESIRTKQPHDPQTRVLMLDPLDKTDITETMRGDHFHEALVKWILNHESNAFSWRMQT
jgi:hypothetical protein